MELWVPRKMMDGLLLWLSRIMRFPVSLSSLERSNHLLSRCRYALDIDNNSNYIFRVHYSACNVQTQNGFHSLEILMVKKTASGINQSNRYILKCPALTAALGREKVRCDPVYVQVSRPLPLGNSDVQDWYLTFRGELVVAVEDASLIGVEVEMNDVNVIVRGLRGQLLNPRQFLDRQTDILPLWMAHGFYAYSLEASCPPVSQHPGEEVVVYIPKQRVGLVKRGSYTTETLTLKNIVSVQAISITVTENKQFVMVNIPANEVLQRQDCGTPGDTIHRIQPYYRIDLVLEFAEIAYPMNWTLENYYECSGLSPNTTLEANGRTGFSANIATNTTRVEQQNLSAATTPNRGTTLPLPTNLTAFSLYTQEKQVRPYPITSVSALESQTMSSESQMHLVSGVSVKATEISHRHFVESADITISGSGDYSESLPYNENTTLESSDLGSGTQEHYPDALLLNAYNKSKRLLDLPRSSAMLTGSYFPAEIAGRDRKISINNTNPGKATQQPSEIKQSLVAQYESLKNITFRPDIFTTNISNTNETTNQLKVFSKNDIGGIRSTLSQRPMSEVDNEETLHSDAQSETAKEGLLSLSSRAHQISKGKQKAEITGKEKIKKDQVGDQEQAEPQMPILTVKGQNRQPDEAQFSPRGGTGHPPSLSDNLYPLSRNPQYSIAWSTSHHQTEEILNKMASEIEMTVSDEHFLLASSE
ncbi:uncharacterized protein C1orf127 homolog [Mantella aurantiaca]